MYAMNIAEIIPEALEQIFSPSTMRKNSEP